MPVGTDARAVKWLDDVSPIPMRSLEHFVSFDDAIPAHKVIFSGKIFDLDRYLKMAEYNWGIAFPPSIFEIDVPAPAIESSTPRPAVHAPIITSASSSTASPSTLTSRSSSSGPHRPMQNSTWSSPCKFIFLSLLLEY